MGYVLYMYMRNTKKIKVTLSLRKELWEKYQQYCRENDLVPSYEIQMFIRKSIKRLPKE